MSRMTCGHLSRFFIILALLWSSIIFSQGSPFIGNVGNTFGRSIFDAGRSLQWTGCDGDIAPYRPEPLIFAERHNNPPEIPITPIGNAIGVPAASYSYSTFAVDPDGDHVKCTLDWETERNHTRHSSIQVKQRMRITIGARQGHIRSEPLPQITRVPALHGQIHLT